MSTSTTLTLAEQQSDAEHFLRKRLERDRLDWTPVDWDAHRVLNVLDATRSELDTERAVSARLREALEQIVALAVVECEPMARIAAQALADTKE